MPPFSWWSLPLVLLYWRLSTTKDCWILWNIFLCQLAWWCKFSSLDCWPHSLVFECWVSIISLVKIDFAVIKILLAYCFVKEFCICIYELLICSVLISECLWLILVLLWCWPCRKDNNVFFCLLLSENDYRKLIHFDMCQPIPIWTWYFLIRGL